MAKRKLKYPNDLVPGLDQIPERELAIAVEVAEHEVWRFVRNLNLFDYDLKKLCVSVYLQGCLDGAQVQRKIDPWKIHPEQEI